MKEKQRLYWSLCDNWWTKKWVLCSCHHCWHDNHM